MRKLAIITMSGAALALAGCATSSGGIAASYSPPMMYQGYSCQQLLMEDQMLVARTRELGGAIDRRATNDKIAMGVGVVLFWPALFFVKGDGPEAGEYARLKGQHDSIQQVSTMRGCMGGMASLAGGGVAPMAPPGSAAAFYAPAGAPTMSYQEWLARYPTSAPATPVAAKTYP